MIEESTVKELEEGKKNTSALSKIRRPCVDAQAFPGRNVEVLKNGVLSQGVIHKKIHDDLYIVKMVKSNSFMGVHPSEMILEEAWPVGARCLARWSEDKVWYRAQVVELLGGDRYRVTFTDYGNQDVVTAVDMVNHVDQIPDGECVNELIQSETDEETM